MPNSSPGNFFSPIFVAFLEYLNFKSQQSCQILPRGIFFPKFLWPSRNISTLNRNKFLRGIFFFFPQIVLAFSEYLNFKSKIQQTVSISVHPREVAQKSLQSAAVCQLIKSKQSVCLIFEWKIKSLTLFYSLTANQCQFVLKRTLWNSVHKVMWQLWTVLVQI